MTVHELRPTRDNATGGADSAGDVAPTESPAALRGNLIAVCA